MNTQTRSTWGEAQHLTQRVVRTLEHFLHIEAVSGGVLIFATLAALLWANSPAADAYHHLWHTPISLGIGEYRAQQSLHFLVNEGLMTLFFLLAGLEIRRELHEGALSTLKQATLPLIAAFGGVLLPAAIYLSINSGTELAQGWAVPIATDIAFALGVLALLGTAIPRNVRVLLLALAIIDDVLAVLVIALFYSDALQPSGAWLSLIALTMVLLLQRLGIRSALIYIAPSALLWFGLLQLGLHPTLAGVMLGLITPVAPLSDRSHMGKLSERIGKTLWLAKRQRIGDEALVTSLRDIQQAQRDVIPPVVEVQSALHPWIAYGLMPLFAFANAGVTLDAADAGMDVTPMVVGIVLALLLGKFLGIFGASAIAVRLGWCKLSDDVGWRGLCLAAMLGAIGFTMSIFIATLAFGEGALLESAKLAVLIASLLAALLSFALGKMLYSKASQ